MQACMLIVHWYFDMPKITIRKLFLSALYKEFDASELCGDRFVFFAGYV